MSILVNASTRVITQGTTGETGTFHTQQVLAYGTRMVGGDAGEERDDARRFARVRHGSRGGKGTVGGASGNSRVACSARLRSLHIACVAGTLPLWRI